MLLHSKEGRITTIGTGLQKAQPGYDKGQDATATNWRSNQQTQGAKYFNKLDLIWGYNNVQIKEGDE